MTKEEIVEENINSYYLINSYYITQILSSFVSKIKLSFAFDVFQVAEYNINQLQCLISTTNDKFSQRSFKRMPK